MTWGGVALCCAAQASLLVPHGLQNLAQPLQAAGPRRPDRALGHRKLFGDLGIGGRLAREEEVLKKQATALTKLLHGPQDQVLSLDLLEERVGRRLDRRPHLQCLGVILRTGGLALLRHPPGLPPGDGREPRAEALAVTAGRELGQEDREDPLEDVVGILGGQATAHGDRVDQPLIALNQLCPRAGVSGEAGLHELCVTPLLDHRYAKLAFAIGVAIIPRPATARVTAAIPLSIPYVCDSGSQPQVTHKDVTAMAKIRPAGAKVWPAEPRTTVQVQFPDGRIFEGPKGTLLADFMDAAEEDQTITIVAAMVGGKLRELSMPVEGDSIVIPVSITAADGLRIYQRALSFLLVVAAHELFPEAQIIIDHSLTLSGLYCEVQGRPPFAPQEVRRLEQRMREIVDADEPIVRRRVPVEEAQEIFARQGYMDKVRLLRFRQKGQITIYELRGLCDYYYGHMVPSTRYLQRFGLSLCGPGLILLFPRREAPTALPIVHEYPRLSSVFQEHHEWLELLGVGDAAGLNEAIESGRMQEVILVAEALHAQRIAEIAREIAENRDRIRVVLIAGPSCSGKTTLAKRLAIQLIANGVRPLALAIDDYFVDRDATPKNENGEYDFECLDAVDLGLLNEHIRELLAGRRVLLPRYDFSTGRRSWGREVAISSDQVLLLEGIHGLNPDLLPGLPAEHAYRIYVSALTQLNLDHHNRVPTTDTRLVRRIVRDARTRGYTAQETIQRWESVTAGERRNIFPYQESADAMFNSALAYELAVLKPFVEPLLAQIDPGTMEYVEARRLLAFLEWFLPWPADMVPDNSLLREFIGGSSLREFVL